MQDDELAEVLDLVERKSEKQVQKEKETDELLELLNKRSAADEAKRNQFKTAGGSKLKEFCRNGTREVRSDHGRRALRPHPLPSDPQAAHRRLPRRLLVPRHVPPHGTCKFIHYEVDPMDAAKMRVCGDASSLDPFSRTAANKLDDDKFKRLRVAVRQLRHPHVPDGGARQVPVIMADPPWDIHMELPYGTMGRRDATTNVQVCMPPARPCRPRLTPPSRASGAAGRRRDVPVGDGAGDGARPRVPRPVGFVVQEFLG